MTKLKVNCKICNKEELIYSSRNKSYKTCSKKCLKLYKESFLINNCVCTNCKKNFHIKESQIKRYNRNMGTFCSMKCSSEYKKSYYKGEINPNFRGKQYDSDGYRINHYPKIGRMKEHLFITLQVLKITKIPKGYVIHHRDCNIYNNEPINLVIFSESDHRWIHKQYGNATLWAFMNNKITFEELVDWSNDKERSKKLLNLSILDQTGVFKQGELLENPTLERQKEDNQQPNLNSNVLEGSTTNSRVLSKDSNADTSALPENKSIIEIGKPYCNYLHNKCFGDDIV